MVKTIFCSSCGAKMAEGDAFCSECGASFEDTIIKEGNAKINMQGLKSKAAIAGGIMMEKASDMKDSVIEKKDEIKDKLTELDRMLESSITEYNDAYTLMNDKGIKLFVERNRAVDVLSNVEELVNSIANRPKSFESDFEEISLNRNKFIDSCEFAERELHEARKAAGGAGAGLAAGASVAFMGPTAAMWIATTFGTASTGTAISALSGAAATNAALAWLGGGAVAAGGGGMAGGSALLAMAGPVGWTIAGATLLTSILLFTSKKVKLNKQKNEEIEAVKNNILQVREMDAEIAGLLQETKDVKNSLNNSYKDCLSLYKGDYSSFDEKQKSYLGSMVNYAKALSVLFDKTLE